VSISTSPVAAGRHGRTPGSGATVGRLVVGDYVGQSAAHAAQAVRRTGLRPGLDRSFGCEANLIGTIVAQDPPAGSEIARNAMVTLYVAAPGPAIEQETADSGGRSDDQSATHDARTERAETDAQPRYPGARRPRKPGGAAGASPQIFDSPLEPAMPSQPNANHVRAPAPEPIDATPPHEVSQHSTGQVASHIRREYPLEDTAVHLENMFASSGRQLPPWRRTYPRTPIAATFRRLLASAASHRVLATATGALFALWIALVFTGAVASHPSGTHRPKAISQREPAARTPRTSGERIPAPIRRGRARTVASTSARKRGRRAVRPRRALAKSVQIAARSPGAAGRSATGSRHALPAAAVSTPAPPEPQQRSGGPFSP
jgi:hypothetical protein